MANICTSKLIFRGSKEEIEKLYNGFKSVSKEETVCSRKTIYFEFDNLDNFFRNVLRYKNIDEFENLIGAQYKTLRFNSAVIEKKSDTEIEITEDSKWVPDYELWIKILKDMDFRTITFAASSVEYGDDIFFIFKPAGMQQKRRFI